MEKIEFVIRLEKDRDSDRFDLSFDLLIDGKPYEVEDNIDLNEFEKSVTKDGLYFIFTCDCGAAGCIGLNHGIEVTRDERRIRWEDWDVSNEDGSNRVREFLIEDYQRAWSDLIERLKWRLNNMDPVKVEVVPFTNRDLLTRVTGISGWYLYP